MGWYPISTLLASLVCFTLSFFVYHKKKSADLNRNFALLTIAIGYCCFTSFIVNITHNKDIALLWTKALNAGVILIAPISLRFVQAIEKKKESGKLIKIIWFFSVIFLISNFTPILIKEVNPAKYIGFSYIPGRLYGFLILFFIGVMFYDILKIFIEFVNSIGYKRSQLKYFLFALTVAVLGSIAYFLVNIKSKIEVPPLDNFLIIAFVLITAFAIVKHRLMDINIVIGKGVTYFVLLAIFSAVYYGLTVGLDKTYAGSPNYDYAATHFLVFLVIVTAIITYFPRLKLKTEKAVERALFKNKYEYRNTLRKVSHEISSIIDLNQLSNYIVTQIRDAMKIDRVSILLLNEQTQSYVIESSCGIATDEIDKVKLVEKDVLIQQLKKMNKPLIKEEIERLLPKGEFNELSKRLELLGVNICIPLTVKSKLIGILALDERSFGEIFSEEDLTLLSTIANQAAVVIDNIRLYEKMRHDDRFTYLGTLAAGVAHEMKNPLSAIKTFHELLPDELKKAQGIDPEFSGSFYKITLSEIDRLNEIIESLLDYSRSREPVFEPHDINDLLDKTLLLLKYKITKSNIKVIKEYGQDLPAIVGDKGQLEQVFINVLDNGIWAMDKLEDKKLTIKTQQIGKFVQVSITDTGIGIPAEQIDSIFEPFFTTKHEGAGLGLSIVRRIVNDHRGKISVISKVGKGSTFFVDLPIAGEEMKTDTEGMVKSQDIKTISPKLHVAY